MINAVIPQTLITHPYEFQHLTVIYISQQIQEIHVMKAVREGNYGEQMVQKKEL